MGLVLRDKQVEKYNIFVSIEDVMRMLRNLRFCVDNIEAHVMHVESHTSCDSDGGEKLDPLGSSAQNLSNISSSDNE